MRGECSVLSAQCSGRGQQALLRSALFALSTLIAAALHAQTPMQLTTGDTRTFAVAGLTAAYAVDPTVAEASARGGVLTVIARGAGTTRVVVVTMDATKTLDVTVVAPVVTAPANASRPQSATVETRYSGSARQLTTSVDAYSTQGTRRTEMHVMVARTTGDRPGLARTSFPSASYTIITPGQRLTFLDAGVDNSPLTLTGTNLRGVHAERGAWRVHAGVVGAAFYDGLVLPVQRDAVAGVSYVMNAAPKLRLMPSVYAYRGTSRGAVASMLADYGDDEHLRLRGEVGVSRGLGAALQAALNTELNRVRADVRFSPRNFAGAGPNALHGLYSDGTWISRPTERLSFSSAASFNRYMLPRLSQRSVTATADARYRLTNALSLLAGANYGSFSAISPRGEHAESFTLPAGLSLDFARAGVTALVRFGDGSGGGSTRGYRLSGRASLGSFSASAYFDREVDAPSLQLVFRERPDLALALEQLGLSADSPQQIAQLLRDNAALINLGFIEGASVDLSLLKVQSGLDLVWSSGGVGRDQIRLRLLRNRAEHVSFATQSDIAMLSYARRLGGTTVQLTLSEWTTDGVRDRAVDVSLRRSFDGLPSFGGGTIDGVVFADDDMLGVPPAAPAGVANVELLLDGTRSTRSDGRGRYSFSGVGKGVHRVDARLPVPTAYFSTSSHAEVSGGEHADFGVASTPARVSGRVVSDAGEGVGGIALALVRGERRMTATSASDGSFAFVAPPGEWRVTLDRDSLPTGFAVKGDDGRDVTLERNAPRTVELQLAALRSISGQLPQRGEVELREKGSRVVTDDSGHFIFRSLAPGDYTVVAKFDGATMTTRVSLGSAPGAVTASFAVTSAAPAPASPRGGVPQHIASAGDWLVQLGAFHERGNVEDLLRRLRAAGITAVVRDGARLTFVQIGPFASEGEAARASARVASAGFEAAVVRNPNR